MDFQNHLEIINLKKYQFYNPFFDASGNKPEMNTILNYAVYSEALNGQFTVSYCDYSDFIEYFFDENGEKYEADNFQSQVVELCFKNFATIEEAQNFADTQLQNFSNPNGFFVVLKFSPQQNDIILEPVGRLLF